MNCSFRARGTIGPNIPFGYTVNANIAMATGFSVHHDKTEAKARGLEAFQYFGFALGHFYVYGPHKPGVTDVWERFQAAKASLPDVARPDVARGNAIGPTYRIGAAGGFEVPMEDLAAKNPDTAAE
jgi:hypothetical protein